MAKHAPSQRKSTYYVVRPKRTANGMTFVDGDISLLPQSPFVRVNQSPPLVLTKRA